MSFFRSAISPRCEFTIPIRNMIIGCWDNSTIRWFFSTGWSNSILFQCVEYRTRIDQTNVNIYSYCTPTFRPPHTNCRSVLMIAIVSELNRSRCGKMAVNLHLITIRFFSLSSIYLPCIFTWTKSHNLNSTSLESIIFENVLFSLCFKYSYMDIIKLSIVWICDLIVLLYWVLLNFIEQLTFSFFSAFVPMSDFFAFLRMWNDLIFQTSFKIRIR